jgi:hypothetical protein
MMSKRLIMLACVAGVALMAGCQLESANSRESSSDVMMSEHGGARRDQREVDLRSTDALMPWYGYTLLPAGSPLPDQRTACGGS